MALAPGPGPGMLLEVVIMTGTKTTIQWGRTHNGPRKGTRNAKSGRKIDAARQAHLDKVATVLKLFIGSEKFISVRERGDTLTFREDGQEIAEATASQDFDNRDDASIDIICDDESVVTVTLAAMAAQPAAKATLDKGSKKRCWIVKSVGDDGSATYKPAGVAYVDGEAMPVREGAARTSVALQLAWAMTPKSGKGGKRVKANIRTKDGKGTRYAFRFNGEDVAEFYHDGRFTDLAEGRPLEHYLARAGIPCVEQGNTLMAKCASLMLSPKFASDIDESAEPYDNDEAYFGSITRAAVENGLLEGGQSIEDYEVVVENGKLTLFRMGGRSQIREVEPEFVGSSPAARRPRPSARRHSTGRPSQSAASAPAQVAAAPVAA